MNNFNINFPNENNINVNQNLYLGSGSYGVVFKSGTGKFVKKITLFQFEDQENIDKIENIRNILIEKYGKKTYQYFIIPYKIDTLLSYQDVGSKIRTTKDKNKILQKVRHMFYIRSGIEQQIQHVHQFLSHVYQKRNNKNINQLSQFIGQKISFNGLNNQQIQNLLEEILEKYELSLKQRIHQQFFAIEYSHFWPNSHELLQIKTLTSENCLFVVQTLIEELKMLHENNIFHNDLKPENIILSQDNINKKNSSQKWFPRILDFGLSMIIDKKYPHLTKRIMLGTFSFLPTDYVKKPQRMLSIIKKFHNFPTDDNKINLYNDFLVSEWDKVSNNKNKNKIHQNELTKKILFYTDIFCLTLCFQTCFAKTDKMDPKWYQFLNFCLGTETPTTILQIEDVENVFTRLKNIPPNTGRNP